MKHPAGVDGALDRLAYRPDIGELRWRHPGVVRRVYVPSVAQALAATTPGARVLDVGCGFASVARALALQGRIVLAIDGDPNAIAGAEVTLHGTDAVARLVEFGADDGLEPRSFDVIRFGRVLHHIPDLAGAVAHTATLLAPGGVVIVEEFAPERIDERSAAWLVDRAAALAADGIVLEGAPADAAVLLSSWRERVARMLLHSAEAVAAALRERFSFGAERWEGGLWAELGKRLVDPDTAADVAARLVAEENAAIVAGNLPAVTLRLEGVLRAAGETTGAAESAVPGEVRS
jgi:SAM-dependent methyltransferase